MRGVIFLLLFDFAVTTVISDLLPTINITIAKGANDIMQTEIAKNCCVINFSSAFKIFVYMPKQLRKKIECFKADNLNDIIITKDLIEDRGVYSAFIPKATAYMATEWKCRLYNLSPVYTRKFKVHVRGKGLGILYINKNKVESYPTEYTTLDYDEYTFHHYIDGEMTLFKCTAYKYLRSPQILYQNKDGKIEIFDNKEAVLHLKLTKEQNKAYLDCKITEQNADGIISSTLRVFFKMKTALDFPRFMINEMVLTPVSQSNTEYYNPDNPNGTFVYDYYNNETVIIRTRTGNNLSLRCSDDRNSFQTVEDLSLKTTLTEQNNNLILTCTTRDNQQQKENTMSLILKYIISSYFYPLSGLSWANVLAKYLKHKDVVVKYSYRVDRLPLTCHQPDVGMKWEFDESQIRSVNVTDGQDEKSGEFWETKSFEMKYNHNRTTIKCYMDYGRSAEVELIRDGPLQFENTLNYFNFTQNKNIINTPRVSENGNQIDDSLSVALTSTPNILLRTDFKEENNDINNNVEESFFKKHFKFLLICASIILAMTMITITLYLIMKRLKQKRKEQANSSNINYENLPEHNDGPMPIPQQWKCEDDDVAYSTPDVDKDIGNLYAKPLPKALRTQKTAIYAEAFDHTNRPGADYVNTGRFIKKTAREEKDDSYSEVYQGNKGLISDRNLKYANIDQINETYAQVEPKTMRDCNNIVSSKENLYGNLNGTDDQLPTHYSEPAYAEISN